MVALGEAAAERSLLHTGSRPMAAPPASNADHSPGQTPGRVRSHQCGHGLAPSATALIPDARAARRHQLSLRVSAPGTDANTPSAHPRVPIRACGEVLAPTLPARRRGGKYGVRRGRPGRPNRPRPREKSFRRKRCAYRSALRIPAFSGVGPPFFHESANSLRYHSGAWSAWKRRTACRRLNFPPFEEKLRCAR